MNIPHALHMYRHNSATLAAGQDVLNQVLKSMYCNNIGSSGILGIVEEFSNYCNSIVKLSVAIVLQYIAIGLCTANPGSKRPVRLLMWPNDANT